MRLERRITNPIQELLKDWMEDLDRGFDGDDCWILVWLACIKMERGCWGLRLTMVHTQREFQYKIPFLIRL